MNNTIWIISGMELTQVNPINRSSLLKVRLNRSIGTVQGLNINDGITVADSEGIKDFSMNGELRNEILMNGIKSIQVTGSEVLTVCTDGLLIWNRLTTLSKIIKLPGDFSMVSKAGDYYHFVKGSVLFTYQLKE